MSLDDARIEKSYEYRLKTGELKEEAILANGFAPDKEFKTSQPRTRVKLINLGDNILRCAMDKYDFFAFHNLRGYFPHLTSVGEYISSPRYLGEVEVEVVGAAGQDRQLTQRQKLEIALFVLGKIADQARANTADYVGSKVFKAHLLKKVFGRNDGKKMLKLDSDSPRVRDLVEVDLLNKDWFAQNEIYGTEEEKNFIVFIDGVIEKLRKKYSDIALLRNEKHIKVYDFDDGQGFEPDFLMILKKRNHLISIYQIFIEPKGDLFKGKSGGFDDSQEAWKQKFLLDLETKAETDLKIEGKDFKLIGLPFYNQKLQKDFEEALEEKLFSK